MSKNSLLDETSLPDIPNPGTIVKARGREWIVLPQNIQEKKDKILRLRPLGGYDQAALPIFWPLEGKNIERASFKPPDPKLCGSHNSAMLLRDSFLLKLRAGAGPFRSLGNISIEPRPYQLVPLLIALKQSISRILIADEVGLGKTVEALLIARELLDRGEIQKITVICPPHLCDKWKNDMVMQFNLPAEIVRPGTAKKLEKGLIAGQSIFDVIPFTVVSLDWIKSDKNRESFQRSCSNFVIVDEAHTCAARSGRKKQQRFQLINGLAQKNYRHMILLTATPHSGDKEAFDNLLGLLNKKFSNLSNITELQVRKELRNELGNFFIQRRRQDIQQEWGVGGADFPDRETCESIYNLSGDWGELFDDVLDYARDLVKRNEKESRLKKRISWWAALALLRCISSSPAAASASLQTKLINIQEQSGKSFSINSLEMIEDIDEIGQLNVLDGDEDYSTQEAAPGSNILETQDESRIKSLINRSEILRGKMHDPKLRKLIIEINELRKDLYKPVVFCRFRPTAHYLAEELEIEFLNRNFVIRAITGELQPEERMEQINFLQEESRKGKTPILIATDCLSEGIDLQHTFDAIIHYDLCWNPTRHEQREGRIDRFGQSNPKVRALMLHGGVSNKVDERVRKVILEKEKTIRKELGVSVPIPGDINKITEAIIGGVLTKENLIQPSLNFGFEQEIYNQEQLEITLTNRWESAKEKAKNTRTIFAQRSLKPEEALKEWNKTKENLGDEMAVERFIISACKTLNIPIGFLNKKNCWEIDLNIFNQINKTLIDRLNNQKIKGLIKIGFKRPLADGVLLIGRSHTLVSEIANFISEKALSGIQPIPVSRSSVLRTESVKIRTSILLLRLRHQLNQEVWTKDGYKPLPNLLVEECLTVKIDKNQITPLNEDSAKELFDAQPVGNIETGQKILELNESLNQFNNSQKILEEFTYKRAKIVEEDHRRVREASLRSGEAFRMKFNCNASSAIDLIGIFLLLPAVKL